MAARKTSRFILSALLWLWAALAAGLHFTEMPSLFNLSPTTAGPAYALWGAYELYLFLICACFLVFIRPDSSSWVAAGGIGLLVVIKVLWLEPLLSFRTQTIWDGVRPFNFIPLLYSFSEIVKIGLLLYTSYYIYKNWVRPKSGSRQQPSGQQIRGKQLHHPT